MLDSSISWFQRSGQYKSLELDLFHLNCKTPWIMCKETGFYTYLLNINSYFAIFPSSVKAALYLIFCSKGEGFN